MEKERSSFSMVDVIIHKRKLIGFMFGVLIAASVVCNFFVKVNYDLTKYLPESVESKQAINLMEEEFGYPGTARIMIEDVSIYQAKLYKAEIEKIKGVDMVSWMSSDVYMSQSFVDLEKQEEYFKDDCAVMDITFIEGDSAKETKQAINEIKKLLGEKGRYSGSAVESKSLEETLTREVAIAMGLAVVLILLILCLTTNSWFEPFLFLAIMGIAIILNMGSNLLLGTISFLSSSVASILQLAISMDYSIFLLHTYTREKKTGLGKEQAMSNAIRISSSSILSSALTTFVGFLALLVMRFGIGKDVGLVLAKSIICSVATVLLLMPALIIKFDDLIERTAHKPFIPEFHHLGNRVFRIRYGIFILMLVVAVPSYVGQKMNSYTFGNSSLGASEGTVVYDDTKAIEEKFGRSNLYLAIVPNGSIVKERRLAEEIEDLYYVKSVTAISSVLPEGVPESIVPKSITDMLRSDHYTRMLIYTKTAGESEFAFQTSDELSAVVRKYYPENAYLVGNTPATQDMKSISTVDYMFVNILSLLGVAVVVAFTFKSGVIAVVVMIPICLATYINMALPYLYGETMMFWGYVIVSCIQLGATVDYSILLSNNYLDERLEFQKKEAIIRAVNKSALSIFTSGLILTVVGYGLFFISSVSAVGMIGHLVGRGAVLSLIFVVFGLPALLVITDKIIFKDKQRIARREKDRKRRAKKLRDNLHEKRMNSRQRKRLLLLLEKYKELHPDAPVEQIEAKEMEEEKKKQSKRALKKQKRALKRADIQIETDAGTEEKQPQNPVEEETEAGIIENKPLEDQKQKEMGNADRGQGLNDKKIQKETEAGQKPEKGAEKDSEELRKAEKKQKASGAENQEQEHKGGNQNEK